MERAIIDKIKGFGFDVYMRSEDDTYLYFTDGKRIGHMQVERFGGFSISTVHKPNHTSGTGYGIKDRIDDFTKDDLELCFVLAPSWAFRRDLSTIVKWRDIDEFIGRDSFNKAFAKIK